MIDQLQEDVTHVRPSVEKTRPNVTKNPDVDRLEEDVNRMTKRWGNCCMQVGDSNTLYGGSKQTLTLFPSSIPGC